jgi:hypothetical protein
MIEQLRPMTIEEIKIYTQSCEQIIKNGNCNSISCRNCPFNQENSINNKNCTENGLFKWENPDYTLIMNAKDFIKEMMN